MTVQSTYYDIIIWRDVETSFHLAVCDKKYLYNFLLVTFVWLFVILKVLIKWRLLNRALNWNEKRGCRYVIVRVSIRIKVTTVLVERNAYKSFILN